MTDLPVPNEASVLVRVDAAVHRGPCCCHELTTIVCVGVSVQWRALPFWLRVCELV
jgi:hypothetical protein